MYTALPSQVQQSRCDDEGSDAGVEVLDAKRDNAPLVSAKEPGGEIRVTQIQVPCIDNDSAQSQGLSGFVEDDLLQYPDTWCDAHDAKVVIHVVVTDTPGDDLLELTVSCCDAPDTTEANRMEEEQREQHGKR